MPQLKVQNFYSTVLTSDIVGTGDTSFTVTTPPTYTSGFLVISPSNAALREIVYFHNVVGNTISVRVENRGQGGTTARAHTSQEPVAMKDIAEIFNMFSDSLSQCFFVEKTGGLNIKVWGGTVFYNGNPVTVSDTALTLVDNQTNYIKYSYPTNTISVDTVNSGNIKARVITLAGVITSIQYYVAKESYIDFTVAITGALPSQVGQAGKVLGTDGTNVSWVNPLSSATTSAVGGVELSLDSEIISGASTGSTGPLVMTPAQLQYLGLYGDSSDGTVIISTNTTLTRDMHYVNLTVNTGITLDPNGYMIYVSGTLTLTGTAKIIRNGNNGTAAAGTTIGIGGAALNNGACGVNLGGLNGALGSAQTGLGSNPISPSPSYTLLSSAAGGAGGGGNGFSGGTSTTGTGVRGPLYNVVLKFYQIVSLLLTPARTTITGYFGMPSSSGGGGGGGNGSVVGGGGGGAGGNGGIIQINAKTLAGSGTIEAKGGNGGAGGSLGAVQAGGGGGGAGGNGGIFILVYNSGAPFTAVLTGGSGAAGGTGFSSGSAGSTGTTGISIVTQI